MKKPIPIW